MRLSRIKLAGFKSFVDPATVELPSNITGIVGPNGCGKSNVIDAVRWVMGESSARNLRGITMTDVIFNGSSARQPVGQASIELVFDNSDQSVGGQFAAFNEISVRRVVGRDGHSDYYLNGTRCRRKDITDLFLGTGIGPRSYAIIEQGMISSLIEARPEELRVYIEEAAGVSKYKERRQETESRLQSTRDNLARLSDLRDEIGRQIDRLKRQARQAEKYTTFKQQEKIARGAQEFLRRDALDGQQAQIGQRIGQHTVQIDELTARLRTLETRFLQTNEENHTQMERLKETQSHVFTLGTEIVKIEQAITFHQKQHQDLQHKIRQIEQDQVNVTQQSAQKRQDQGALEIRLKASEQEHQTTQATLEKLQSACNDLEAQFTAWTQAHEAFLRSGSEPLSQLKAEQARIEQNEQQLRYAERQHARLLQERAELAPEAAQVEIEQLREQERNLQSQIAQGESELSERNAQAQTLRGTAHEQREQLAALRDSLGQWRGQLASLEVLQKSAVRDTEKKMRRFFEAQGLKDAPCLLDKLTVASGWELAAEIVLNDSLHGLLVDPLADYYAPLHATREGSGTLLTATLTNSAPPPRRGTLEPLAALVDQPEVAKVLCTGVYCAPDLDTALTQLNTLAPGESIILSDGFRLGHGWARTPALNDPTTGVLQRKKQMAELVFQIETANTAENESTAQLETLKQTLLATDRQREQTQQHLQSLHRELSQVQGRLSARIVRLEQMNERLRRVTHELSEWEANQQKAHQELATSRARLASAQLAQQTFEAENQRRLRERAALSEQRDEARRLRDATVRLDHQQALAEQQLRSQTKALDADLARLEQQRQQLQVSATELQAQLHRLDTVQVDQARSELDALLDQRTRVETEQRRLQELIEGLGQTLERLEKERHETEKEIQKHKDTIQTEKLSQHEIQLRRDQSSREIALLGMNTCTSLDAILGFFDTPVATEDLALSEAEWGDRLDELHAKIERLGPINLAAIDEYQVQNERKVWLDQQNDDLCEAIATLEDAIRKIDKETRARFEQTFEQVNQGIQKMFPRLFGGGHAYLELNSNDLLNSGVTLMARPPGKRISNIQLMSGGEKALTAIALVFSIFELNPAPFCMLDEVDAPLDDNNIGRFNDLVREMSERVQFIVITHNKVTMEIATHLTGVTMSEPGVSRLVTVNVQEAVDILQPGQK